MTKPNRCIYTYNNRSQTAQAWADEFGIQRKAMLRRIATMPPDEAFANPYLTFRDETLRLGEWAKRLGICRSALRFRLANWPLEEAMCKPPGPRGKKIRRTQ